MISTNGLTASWTFLTDVSSTPCTFAFDSAKLCWTGGPMHDQFQRILLHFTHRVDKDGYICVAASPGVGTAPIARTATIASTIPMRLLSWPAGGCTWTGDRRFLDSALPTVRKAADFLLGKMHGREGVLTIDSPEHSGVPSSSAASNYFDCIPAGYRDAYINAFFGPLCRPPRTWKGRRATVFAPWNWKR